MKALLRAGFAWGAALAALALPPGFVLPDPGLPAAPPLAQALEHLSRSRISEHLTWLADPSREGRGLGTAGLDATARNLVHRLRAAGLKPLGSSYLQDVPLRAFHDLQGRLTLRAGARTWTWVHGKDARLPEMEPGVLEAPSCLVGHGLLEPDLGWDDLRDLDLKGRVVILRDGLPSDPRWQTPAFLARHGGKTGMEARISRLEARGARWVVVLHGEGSPLPPTSRSFYRAARGLPFDEGLPVVHLPACAEAVFRDAGPGARLRMEVQARVKPHHSRNVLATLPGTDPEAPALVLGAHMDHLGRPGGRVHPGADDNASGVSALMEVARILAASQVRPRRTLVFAFWTGEEEGKFGSEHYVRHPRWPLARTFAYLNLDMIGHAWSSESFQQLLKDTGADPAEARHVDLTRFAELGHPEGASALAASLSRAASAAGMALHLDPGTGQQGGSDYRPFARRGVPWIRMFGDFFPGYHSPEDTPDRLDHGQVHRMARLALAVTWELAYEGE